MLFELRIMYIMSNLEWATFPGSRRPGIWVGVPSFDQCALLCVITARTKLIEFPETADPRCAEGARCAEQVFARNPQSW